LAKREQPIRRDRLRVISGSAVLHKRPDAVRAEGVARPGGGQR
jgi:hypothetical protein